MSNLQDFNISPKGELKAYHGNSEVMTVPEGVRIIGKNIVGYSQGKQVKKIVVPEGVVEIQEYAFSSSNISEVVLPSTLQKIGKHAFSSCKDLKTIDIPDGVTVIPEMSFYSCGLERVHLPESIRKIEEMAFYDCRKLKEINLPKHETLEIGRRAFNNCDSLTDKDGLLILQNRLFAVTVGEEKTENVFIPDSVKSIEEGCLHVYGYNLRHLNIDMSISCPSWTTEGRPLLRQSGSSISFRDKDGNKVAYVVLETRGETTPKERKAQYSFKSENGKFDFESYDSIFGILSKTPNKIKMALARIEYPYELSEEMNKVYLEYLKKQGFEAGKILIDENRIDTLMVLASKELLTANTVKKLTEYAKESDKTEFVAWLLNYANENQMMDKASDSGLSLNKKTKSTKKSEGKSIAEWKKLYKFKYVTDGMVITGYKGEEEIVEIPEKMGERKVVGIASEAFFRHSVGNVVFGSIRKIIVPGSIRELERNCFDVSDVEIELQEGITSLPLACFGSFAKGLTVTLPYSLEFMDRQLLSWGDEDIDYDCIHFVVPKGSYAEQRCRELHYIYEAVDAKPSAKAVPPVSSDIQAKAKTNGKEWKKPKAGTHLLPRYLGEQTKLLFPEEVEGIKINGIANTSGDTPYNYRNLVSVELPEGYEYIGNKAFAGCEKLETIKLPKTVNEIGTKAFADCKQLKELVLNGDIKFSGNDIFSGAQIETLIYMASKEKVQPHLFFGCKIRNLVVYGGDFKSNGNVFDYTGSPVTKEDYFYEDEETAERLAEEFNKAGREKEYNFPLNVYIDGKFATTDIKGFGSKHLERIHPLSDFDASDIIDEKAKSILQSV